MDKSDSKPDQRGSWDSSFSYPTEIFSQRTISKPSTSMEALQTSQSYNGAWADGGSIRSGSPIIPTKTIKTNCIDGCTLDGVTYLDPFKIPGNEPIELLHRDGSALLSPSGEPIFGPSRAVLHMDEIAERYSAHPFFSQFEFFHGGKLDVQRLRLDPGKGFFYHDSGKGELFTSKYRDYTNVLIGYTAAASGISVNRAAFKANFYCRYLSLSHCSFPSNEHPSSKYPALSQRLVQDYAIGAQYFNELHSR